MSRQPHREHRWRRIARCLDGSAELVGCSYGGNWSGCVETEVRYSGIAEFRRRPEIDPGSVKKRRAVRR